MGLFLNRNWGAVLRHVFHQLARNILIYLWEFYKDLEEAIVAVTSCKKVNLFPAPFCSLFLQKFLFLADNRGGLCDGGGKVPFALPIKYSRKLTIFACWKWCLKLCLLASNPLVKSCEHVTHTYSGLPIFYRDRSFSFICDLRESIGLPVFSVERSAPPLFDIREHRRNFFYLLVYSPLLFLGWRNSL